MTGPGGLAPRAAGSGDPAMAPSSSFRWSTQFCTPLISEFAFRRDRSTPPDLTAYGIRLEPLPLGEGFAGKAWYGRVRRGGRDVWVVVKESKTDAVNPQTEYLSLAEMADNTERAGGQPHPVRWIERHEAEGPVGYLVMELFPRTPGEPSVAAPNLSAALRGELPGLAARLREPAFRLAFERAVLEELRRIHRAGYAHCDVKPDNLLVGLDGAGMPRVRFIDYGFAVPIDSREHMLDAVGTVGYMDREAWETIDTTARRDVAAAQKLLLYTHWRDYSDPDNIATFCRLRELSGKRWWELKETLDHHPTLIDPNVAVVLASHVPRTPAQLEAMLTEARERPREFQDLFRRRWTDAFRAAPTERGREGAREDLVYELIHATRLGPEIFRRLDRAEQDEVVRIARLVRARLTTPDAPPTLPVGFHAESVPYLDAFLSRADVRAAIAAPR